MEGEVHIRCRKSDLNMILEAAGPATEEYKKLLKAEVKLFRDRDVPLRLIID
jgi:hypothetical protein